MTQANIAYNIWITRSTYPELWVGMISQAVEYALRAVICLAEQPGKLVTTLHIAEASRMPVGYLAKVMGALGKAGIVTSYRGPNGGFVLARDPFRLRLLDVIRVVDHSQRINSCPLGLESHRASLCTLHRRLDAAAIVEELMESATIGQVLADAMGARPLCEHQLVATGSKKEAADG